MWMYWALFCAPALATLSPTRLDAKSRAILVAVVGITLTVVIGLRDHVGADWSGYSSLFDQDYLLPLNELIFRREPGFGLFNWISARFGWDVYGVNFVSAAIFVSGLLAFCRRQPNFWLTLALATPVLIVQVAMGAMRESIAIGILLFGFNAFIDRRPIRYVLWVLLASCFHTSALLLLSLAPFSKWSLTNISSIVFALVFFAAGAYFVSQVPDYQIETYTALNPAATGALPRFIFTFTATTIFLFLRVRWNHLYDDGRLFLVLSIGSVILAPFVFPFPAAVDRLAQYLLPLQIAVFARLPLFLKGRLKSLAPIMILLLYGGAYVAWLNFSWIAKLAWLPYRSLIWG